MSEDTLQVLIAAFAILAAIGMVTLAIYKTVRADTDRQRAERFMRYASKEVAQEYADSHIYGEGR